MEQIKNFFADERQAMKNGLTKLEYLSWWIVRVILVASLIYLMKKDIHSTNILLVCLNILASFTIPLARIILFPKSLVCKIPFRCQTWLNIMILIGSALGQGFGLNHTITNYDKFLHILSGAVVLFIGNELLEVFIRKEDRISPLFRTFAATGFSYMAIVIWEIFEFFVDYYWVDYCNQAYNIKPNPDMLFFKIFGLGAQNENQWAVFDTHCDMLYAVLTTTIAAIILLVYLTKKENATDKSLCEETEKEKAIA